MEKPEEIQPSRYYINLKDRLLTVKRGWNDNIARALVERAHEQEAVKLHPRDAHKRFLNVEAANRWALQDPSKVVYTLALGRAAELAGVIWIARPEETMPGVEAERAFYMRMYESSRGKGEHELAVGFGRAALADYELNDYNDDLGLKIDRDDPSKRVYEDLGFRPAGLKIKPTDKYIQMVHPGMVSRLSGSSRRHRP